jgi:hypothetical protein
MVRISRRVLLSQAVAPLAFSTRAYCAGTRGADNDPHRLMVATWQQATDDATFDDSTNNTLNSRARCVAPAGSGISDIVLAFPGWGLRPTEKPWPSPYSVTASVEYPEGTFHAVYVGGRRQLTVLPGSETLMFEPCPIQIPAGATFYVKCFASWNGGFWMGRSQACVPGLGEWTFRGTGLSDETTTSTIFRTTALAAGFRPAVFGRLQNPTIAMAILGASQEMAYGADSSDPDTGALFIGRAMRNAFPVMNISRAGDSLGQYLYQSTARYELLRGKITHLIMALGSNDIFAGISVDKTFLWLRRAAESYLNDGVRVYGMTVLPRSVSTDHWATKVNQTPVNAVYEAARVAFNARLLTEWRGIGFAGMFDSGHAIDPGDTGVWGADEISHGYGGGGFATVLNGTVASVRLGASGANGPGGAGYPPNSTVPCVILNAPGDSTGAGAVVTMHTDGFGRGASFSVENGGARYAYPPLIAARGQWCSNDGVHECKRGYDAVIAGCNLGPDSFLN